MDSVINDFHLAVRENKVEKVMNFLKNGVDPDEPNINNNGRPAILEAAYHGYTGVVQVLLDAGADPNAQNSLGETALHNAFYPKTFSKELVSLLLQNGAEVNTRERLNGHTPVHMAAKLCASKINKCVRMDILEVLRTMCKTADVTVRNARGENPIHRLVAGNSDWAESLQVLLECGYGADDRNDRGETALMCAIDRGHYTMAETLISKGACVDARDRNLQTALHHAVQKNQSRMVKLLLDARCDVNASDLNGDTALHVAASKGLSEIVRMLLEHLKTEVDVQNTRGVTPLLCAVESGFSKVVEQLLETYIDADCEKGLMKALDVAEDEFVRRWHPEMFPLLREALEQKRDLWDEGETSL